MKIDIYKNLVFYCGLLCLLGCTIACQDDAPGHPELSKHATPITGMLPFFKGRVMDPYWPEGDTRPNDLRGLREFSLTSHQGKAFSPAQLKDKFVLVNFFYATCHGICPKLTDNMHNLSNEIADHQDLVMLSITVNPEMDTPDAMADMRKRHKITRTNWFFLTGDRPQIEKIAREQFAGDVETRKGLGNLVDFVHTENAFLLDQQGYLRGIYRARAKGDLGRLKKDLATLRKRGS